MEVLNLLTTLMLMMLMLLLGKWLYIMTILFLQSSSKKSPKIFKNVSKILRNQILHFPPCQPQVY